MIYLNNLFTCAGPESAIEYHWLIGAKVACHVCPSVGNDDDDDENDNDDDDERSQ